MTPEGKLKADCRKLSRAHGLLFANVEGKSYNGWPDTECGLHPKGRGTVHIEFKKPGAEPEPGSQQWRRINEIRAAGGLATWCNSVADFRDIVFNPCSLLLWRAEDGGIDL